MGMESAVLNRKNPPERFDMNSKKQVKLQKTLLAVFTALIVSVLLACDLLDPGLGDEVDLSAPLVEVNSHINGDYVGGAITLTGTARDDIGVTSVTVSSDAGTVSADIDGENWSARINTASLNDGDNDFTIKVTDTSDKESSTDLLLIVDNNAPTVLVTTPAVYGSDEEFNKTIAVKGEAVDSTRIGEVLVSLYNTSGTPVFTDRKATGTSSWYYTFDSSEMADGTYYIFVKAVDNSGNSNSWFYHFQDIYDKAYDPGKLPNIEDIHSADFEGKPLSAGILNDSLSSMRLNLEDNSRMEIEINSNSDKPEFSFVSPPYPDDLNTASSDPESYPLGETQRFSGFITDDDAVDYSTVQIAIWRYDSGYSQLYNPDNSGLILDWTTLSHTGTQWSYNSSLPDGQYVLKMSADDIYGTNQTVEALPFKVASSTPTFQISSPSQGILVGPGNSLSFQVNVTYMGTGDVRIDVDGNGTFDADEVLTPPTPGPLVGTWTGNFTEGADFNVAGGEQSFIVRVGSPANYVTQSFYYTGDVIPPTAAIDTPSAGDTVNGDMTIRGTAEDNISLSAVYYNISSSSPVFPDDYTLLNGKYSWNDTVDTTGYPEGSYNLRVLSIDSAGNVSDIETCSFSINQNSDLPVFGYTNIDAANDTLTEASGNLLETGAKIIGNISDDDSVDSSTLTVAIYSGNDDSVVKSDGPVSNLPGSDGTFVSWSHNLSSLTDGVYYAVFTVDDINGTTAVSEKVYFTVDLSSAEIVIDSLPNNYLNEDYTLTGTASDPGGLLSGDHDGDGGAATAETEYIAISPNGTAWTNVPVDGSGNWSYTIDVSAEGDAIYTYQIKATDSFGKSTIKTLDITIDTQNPVITIAAPATGDWASGTSLSLNGSATDSNSIVSAEVSLDNSNWTSLTGTTNWTGLLNLSSESDQIGKTIYFRASDIAGNRGTASVDINIDTTAPVLTEVTSGIPGTARVKRNSDISLGGAASDGNGVASVTVRYSKNGGALQTLMNDTTDDGSWNASLNTALGDGDYELTITASDNAGKTTELIRSILIDTASPDLTVETPVDSELIDSASYTISGKISDNGGAGVTELQYSRDNAAWTDIPMTGFSWSVNSVDFSAPVGSEKAQGGRTLYIRATDGLNPEVKKTITFNYDTEDPFLSETSVGTEDQQISAASVIFTGQASDSNSLTGLTLTINENAPVSITVDSNGPDNITGNSDDNAWNYTHPNTTDGIYSLVFTAADAAGRKTTVERNLLIDNTAPGAPVISSSPGDYVINSLSVTGTAHDATSGLASVQYSIDNGGTWHALSGTSNWFGDIDVSSKIVGPQTLSLKATDRAGNTSAITSQNYTVDRDLPKITLTEEVNRDVKGGFSLNGHADDDYGIDFITVSQSKDGGEYKLISANGPSGTTSWSLTDLPRDPDNIGDQDLTDGTYVYKITSTDNVGKTSTELLSTIRLDMTAPETLTVSSPGAGQTGINSLSGPEFTFSGTSSDSGVGIAAIYYLIDQNASASATLADYTRLSTSGYWSFTDDFDTDGDNTDDTGRAEGKWYIHLLAEDSSGNRTDVSSAVTVEFEIDQAAPTLTEVTSGIPGTTRVYRNSDIDLGGVVSDGNGIDSLTVVYSKNGGAPLELLYDTTDDGSWSTSLNALTQGDGDYEVTITATDGVGKTTELIRSILIDTASPDLTVETPVDSELIDSASYTISGKISDNGGAGVTELQYSRDNAAWTDIPMTGFSWSVNSVDFSAPVGSEKAQGGRTLYIRATDGLNPEVKKTITFNYDTEDPFLSETSVGTEDQQISAASVIFTGQASDSNSLTGLTLTINENAPVSITVDSNGPDNITGNSDDNAWNYTHPNTTDGIYSLVFTAADAAGRKTTVERNLLIDNTAPGAPVISSSPGDYVINSLSVTGTAHDATSGLASVQYSIDNGGTWHALSGTSNWFGDIDVSSKIVGPQTLSLKATDRAGNTSAITSQNYTVDRDLPKITLTEEVNRDVKGGFSLNGHADDDYGIDFITVSQSKDGGEYKLISANGPSGTTSWSLTDLPRDPDNIGDQDLTDGTYVYKITSTDNVGKTSTELLSTIRLDMTAPETLTVSSPGAGQTGINSLSGPEFTFSGTSSDSGVGIAAIYYLIDQNASASATLADYTRLSTSGYWSFTDDFDTDGDNTDDTGRAEGKWYIHLLAEDSSGNRTDVSSAVTVEFEIDHAAPVITEDGLGGTNITSNNGAVLEVTISETNGIVHGSLLDGPPVEDAEYFELMINGSDWASNARRIEYTGSDMLLDITADLSDGSNEVLLRATDLAGKVSSIVKRDIFFDKDPPVLTFTNLNSSSVVNGETFSIQGAASDVLSTVSSVSIAVFGPGDSAYGPEQPLTGSLYSWNFPLDLTPSDVYYADAPIKVRATARDSAGNQTVEEVVFAIDQQGDMPSLNLSGTSLFTQYTTAMVTAENYILSGVLYDPDGVDLDSLIITFDSVSRPFKVISGQDNDPAVTWFADISDKAGSTYAYVVSARDSLGNSVAGNHSGMIDTEIQILGSDARITGSAEDDDAFDASSLLLLQNGADLSGGLTIGSDAPYVPWSYTLPAADDLYYFELGGSDATAAAIPVNWSKYGGENLKTMVIKDSGAPVVTIASPAQGSYVNGTAVTAGEAYDDLAINSLTITAFQSDNVSSVELTSDPGVALDTTEGSGEYYYDSAAGKYVWDFALERLPDAYENDSISLIYEAEDIAGNRTVKERSVTIDTVDPLISIDSPGNGNIVNGTVTFQGTVSDAKLSSVEIKLGTGGYETLSGTYNWSKEVSASALISYASDLGDGTYNLPVTVRATDAAGNTGITSAYSIIIDPDTDKPLVNLTSPASDSTLGGSIMIVGSATDDDAVDSVEMRIDFNGDGDFNDILDLNNDGDTSDEFETESSWVEVSNFSNGIWSKEINTLGELYKSRVNSAADTLTGNESIDSAATGAISVQIHAWDINFVESIITNLNISLDETFPEILDFSVTGNPEAINGTFELQWDIVDNEEITSVSISYDGGLTYTDTIYDGSSTVATLSGSKTMDSVADLGLGGLSSTVNVRMKAVDNTTYVSFANLTLNIDNVPPEGVYTGRIEDIGTGDVWVSGTAVDTGAVRGIDKIEVYIVQDGRILEPEGSGSIAPETQDFGGGNVPYTGNDSYKIIIDNDDATQIEIPEDGYPEYMSLAGNTVNWSAQFDSTHIDNSNPLQVHFVIWDKAGNPVHYVETMMMVGTDLDQDGSVEPDEMVAYPQGFKATDLLKVEMDPGSNANLYLYVEHNGSSEIDAETGDGPMAFTVDISAYAEGSTSFNIEVRDSSQGGAEVIQKTLYVDIVGTDTVPPVVKLSPLTQSSLVEGHLETNSQFHGSDYDLSGTVEFDVTASDNSRIQTIEMVVENSSGTELSRSTIARWNAGLFEVLNGAELTKNTLSWENGHEVALTINWDSSSIPGVVGRDVEVRFEAVDFKGLSSNDNIESEGSKTVDVVPYITEIETEIGRANPNNPSVVNRSSLGYYPVWAEEVITVKGYNLQPDHVVISRTGDGLNVSDTDLATDAVELTVSQTITAGREYEISVTNADKSGYLSLISSGFIFIGQQYQCQWGYLQPGRQSGQQQYPDR